MESLNVAAADTLPPAPLEEAEHIELAEAQRVAASLPLNTRFTLRSHITPVQQAFLDKHGFLVFNQVVAPHEVEKVLSELERIEEVVLREQRKKINGVPFWVGRDENDKPFLQRFGFASLLSDFIHELINDARFEPVKTLIGEGARIGEHEKDGVVVNRYIRTPGSLHGKLGWHTDGLRDLFYGRMPKRMLNVGLHMHRIRPEDGGLRLIPGTHEQGFFSMAFGKAYFMDHRADRREIPVETWPGDLTVHDGRLWHRVEQSPKMGREGYRCAIYIPYLTHDFDPKDENSKTPIYQRVFDRVQRMKSWLYDMRRRR